MVLVALPSVKQGLVMVDETSNKADAIKKAKKYKYGFVNKADTETVFSTT